MGKREELLALAKIRQRSRWPGHGCIADYHQGAYECDFVSPYTKSASNIEAPIMVMAQDWSSHERLSGPLDQEAVTFGQMPTLPTNVRLRELLKCTFGVEFGAVYATNLFPFVKLGSLSAAIPRKDMLRAAREFAIPQIRIIKPQIVICLGLITFNALREALGKSTVQPIGKAIGSPFLIERSWVWCQAHTGALGYNNRTKGNPEQVREDWLQMKEHVSKA